MPFFYRKRARHDKAIEELRKSQANLSKAEKELQKRLDLHLDTIERRERMERVLEENHIADLMFDALSKRRR